MSGRTRTPQETFLSDQALAHAREQAKIPGTLSVVLDYATSGQCSWCDCDVFAGDDSHQCGGCPNDAAYVMHQYRHGSDVRNDIPLCTSHKDDAIRFVMAIVQAGGTP